MLAVITRTFDCFIYKFILVKPKKLNKLQLTTDEITSHNSE